jgi:hypothetical protein
MKNRYPSPITRCYGLKIINEISHINYVPIVGFLSNIIL